MYRRYKPSSQVSKINKGFGFLAQSRMGLIHKLAPTTKYRSIALFSSTPLRLMLVVSAGVAVDVILSKQ